MVRHHPKINKKNKRNCAKKCIFYDTLFTVERPLLIETDMIVCLETLQSLTCFFKVMKARARACERERARECSLFFATPPDAFCKFAIAMASHGHGSGHPQLHTAALLSTCDQISSQFFLENRHT